MVYSELEPKPLEKLTRDEEKGWILEDGKRIISFRVKTFQAMVDQLTSMAGTKVAQVLLSEMGRAIGQAGMQYSKAQIRSEADIWKVFDRVLQARGWGRCLGMMEVSQGENTVYRVRCRGTPLSHERTAKEPTCHMVRGVVAGWLEAYHDRKAVSSLERECVSMGHSACVFEVSLS